MNFEEAMRRRRQLNSGDKWADVITGFNGIKEGLKVFLGAGRDAQNKAKLQENQVSFILNVADDVPNFHQKSSEINLTYKNLDVGDFGADSGISRVFDEAADFLMTKVCKGEGNLLIHCANGSNRSATVTMAMLMKIQSFTLLRAWKNVCNCHKQSLPLRDNRVELLKFEASLFSEVSMQEDRGTLIPIGDIH